MKRVACGLVLAVTALAGGCLATGFAQTSGSKPSAPAPVVKPELKERPGTIAPSATLSIAVNALVLKLQANAKEHDELMKAVQAVEAEVRTDHPGYHFDEQTGGIVKDAPPAPASEPAKK